MPIYLYRIVQPGLEKESCPVVEILHGSNERLLNDPSSGLPLERVYTSPSLGGRYSERRNKRLLSHERIAKAGFTKYEREHASGRYIRTVGKEGPESFQSR